MNSESYDKNKRTKEKGATIQENGDNNLPRYIAIIFARKKCIGSEVVSCLI
jgi:hypothetical protein